MTFFTNLTLWKKISLLTIVGLLLGVGVFSSLGMHAANQATETMLQERLTTAQLVADYLDESLGRGLNELQLISRQVTGKDGDLDAEMKALEIDLNRLSLPVYGVYLLNEDGEIIWSMPTNVALIGLSMDSYYDTRNIRKDSGAGISGLAYAPVTKNPVVFLFSGVGGAQSDKGTLVVATDFAESNISGFIKPIRLGETGYVEIIDQNGVVVTRTEPGPKLSFFEESDHSGRFAALIDAGRPTRGVCHTCHESGQLVSQRDVLAFVPLKNVSWGVVVRQSEDEALAPTRELRQNLFLFGGGLMFVALGFVLVTTRNIGSRISALTGAASRIADGDLVSPVPSEGSDEVGILAQTFEGMRTRLKQSYGELEQRTGELASLLSVLEILTSSSNLPDLLHNVVAKAVEIIPAADGGVLLLRQDSGVISIQCSVGIGTDYAISHGGTLAEGPYASLIAPDGNSTDSHDIQQKLAAFTAGQSWYQAASGHVSAGIFSQGRCTGLLVMVAGNGESGFSEPDSRLLQAIADNIAGAIEREQLAKNAEKARAFQELDRLRSQFISSVSHELRTPLTLIKGYTTSLLRKDMTWDYLSQAEFLNIIDDKTNELGDLIDKLLQSAKVEAGALRLTREPLIIKQLVRKTVEDMKLRGKTNRFTMNVAANIPVIEADVRLVEQVLRNLIENAIKYAPEGSEIRMIGENRGDFVIVGVSDQGPGISPEHITKVFERFFRVEGAHTRAVGGTGLGLSIVKGHVEAHGGRVWVESVDSNGSTFYFSLPVNTGEETPGAAEGDADEG